ncbi:MAG: hypothetical protein KF787_04665 [Phycisphaeraceae bacterium]|nr:hypothetical protein [Phycisphaerae bacterium]MBX3391921.1 hypothetical protein [Phycisphaeraceae bacterium]
MFITDRDLLAVEPNLFRDVQWVGQRLCRGTGSALNTTLTLHESDTDFNDGDVRAGHVVVVDGASYEVIDRIGGNELVVSRLRASPLDFAIPVTPAESRPVVVTTFEPQIAMIHRQVLGMLGVAPTPGEGPSESPVKGFVESMILNPRDLAPVEVFGTLFLALSAAAATSGPQSPLGIRASFHRALFSQERARAVAEIDADGDGVAEVRRRMSVSVLRRE